MLSLRFVRENPDLIRTNMARLGRDASVVDRLLVADEAWRAHKQTVDDLRCERNSLSEEINRRKKAGENAEDAIAKAKLLPARLKKAQSEADASHQEVLALLRTIPNLIHDDVPAGKDESENVERKRWGEGRSDTILNHVELCERNGWADFESSAATSGNGFYFLLGDLALLNQALIRYAIETMQRKGFTYIEPPLMLRKKVLDAALDAGEFDQTIYRVADEDLCLIGTSEHSILGMLEGAQLEAAKLPLRYFGYSICFRREIGSHGINEKGLWRTHQFNKVEMFEFTLPEQSWSAFDEMLEIAEAIMQGLKLPYRVLEMCTGDLSAWKARQYDIEVWRPSTQSFGEVGSLSNCTDFQARDLNIRYVRSKGERGVVHTLNNTALATSRVMVAILENFQNSDGSVNVPAVLQPLMGGKQRLEPHG